MPKKRRQQQDWEEEMHSDMESSASEIKLQKYNPSLHHKEPLNRPAIRATRDLYFKDYPYERIFLATAVPPSIFLLYRRKWDKVKAKLDEKLITDIRKRAISDQTTEFVQKGLKVGMKFIDRLLKREEEITPKDWKLISDSIMALHRVRQLETGKPTDISVYENMSPAQATAYLLEMQKQLAGQHEMTMFAPADDVPEEELLREYIDGDNSKVH